MRAGRGVRVLWGIGAVAAAVWAGACENTRNPGGIQKDITAPVISLTGQPDTQDISAGLSFTVTATDNLGLKTIRLTFSGGYIAGPTDTTFISQVKTASIAEHITFPANSGAGGNVMIVGRAIDGAGNFAEDTLFLFLANVQALKVFLVSPSAGAVASTGRGVPVQVIAVQNSGIRKIGFVTSPVGAVTNPTTPPNDSITFTPPYADSVVYDDTLIVVATTGSFVIQGFAEDSAGRRGTSGTVTVSILSAANDVTPPSVTDSLGVRIEVNDSVLVHATDPSAISWIGFRVDTGGVLLRFDSLDVSAGNLTDVRHTFSLNLAGLIGTFPATVVVRGYACDAAVARNCAYSTVSGIVNGTPKADTVTVVNGVTKAFPLGGRIGDAIFNKNGNGGTGELYLTNTTLSRVEIFQVANSSFVAGGIPTAGPQPVGIALWPVDTLGNYDDTVVVANSGGTELSVLDVRAGVRRLAWRQDLPNYLIEKYKIVIGPGGLTQQITIHDVSDRPQYLATVCRTAGSALCATDSIFAIYSTTPTISSSSPFNGKGTLRMEKLINTTNPSLLFGHLFWEIGNVNASETSDTLRVVLRRGQPYNLTQVVLSACGGVTINFATFGLGDSTFVRNSGNFTHALIGEGGSISAQFARVMSYTTKQPLLQGAATFASCLTPPGNAAGLGDAGNNDVDFGMSPAVDVSDFISNTGVHILSIATNFNGGTNLVRADSIYFLDEGLRLKGTACPLATNGVTCTTGAPGMDMNYNHAFQAGNPGTPTFGGSGDPNDRLVFAARPDGNIDVFDTFFYGFVMSMPVRDPIIGPLRVAKDAGGNQLLFGITGRGLVMLKLPTIVNPNPVAPALKTGSP
jgi:hypothetical protein